MTLGNSRFWGLFWLHSSAALLTLTATQFAWAEDKPRYIIDEMGLTDEFHTREDGYRQGSMFHATESGFAAGITTRWNRDSYAGYSAWLYNSATGKSKRIGLIDPEGGETWWNSPQFLNSSGQVAGTTTQKYTGTSVRAWFYDDATEAQFQLGFLDDVHTKDNDGVQYSEVHALTESGHAFGRSLRYEGSEARGESLWAFDANSGGTTRIGLFEGEAYADPVNGTQGGYFRAANSQGFAAGISSRFTPERERSFEAWSYNPTTSEVRRVGMNDPITGGPWSGGLDDVLGVTENRVIIGTYADGENHAVWVHNDATNTTTRTGLFGTGHVSSNGRQSTPSKYVQWNSQGQVIGQSRRYSQPNSSSSNGWSAWVFDPDTTQTKQLGYTDMEHTKTGELYQYSWATQINEVGMVVGGSERWSGTSLNGRTAWLYSPADDTTRKIGDRTRLAGLPDFHSNTAIAVNNRGQVIGTAVQTVGGLGESMWMYDLESDSTRLIGLRDPLHTHPTENYHNSYLHALTDTGLVAGGSMRLGLYPSTEGRTAWLYDFDTDITTPLMFSENSKGVAQSYVTGITEAEIVLGKYMLYDANDVGVMHPFIGSLDVGFFDLHDLIGDGLAPGGWDRLAADIVHLGNLSLESLSSQSLLREVGDQAVTLDWDRFAGMGYRLNGSEVPFATRPVPEPHSAVLLGLGAMGLLWFRWRRRMGTR